MKKIHWCCSKCGTEANRLTCLKRFGKEPIKIKYNCSTYHQGICDVCGNETGITQVRDFYNPDFSLLNK
jgi:hypothetical protein